MAMEPLKSAATFYRMFGFPYMVAIKSRPRRELSPELVAALRTMRDDMPKHHQTDFKDLKTFFGMGGLKCPAGL